jgi:hypothetical protein
VTEDAAGLRDTARLLLAYEAGGGSDPSQMASALDGVFRKLHHQLARVVGDLGVRLIARRAVAVTRVEFPFLAADPDPEADEYLKGLRESLRGHEPMIVTEALTALLINLLAVLRGLLGDDLTHVFLRDAWPEVKIP